MLNINLNFPFKDIDNVEIKNEKGEYIFAHHILAKQLGTKGPDDLSSPEVDEIARNLHSTGLLNIRTSEKDKIINYVEKSTSLFTTIKAQLINAIKEAKEDAE